MLSWDAPNEVVVGTTICIWREKHPSLSLPPTRPFDTNMHTTYTIGKAMATATAPSSVDTTYGNVTHQKSKGSLVISDLDLRFNPDDPDVNVVGGDVGSDRVVLPWRRVSKHQVSPASHPKALLRVMATATSSGGDDGGGNGSSSFTLVFSFPDRSSLERARRDVSARLASRKRPRPSDVGPPPPPLKRLSTPPSSRYVDLDPVALIAARSSLLASDPALRAQHRHLVLDSCTIDEDDFWDTHGRLVADEYAKISGRANGGMSSDIRSSLDLGLSASAMSSSGKKGGGGGGGSKKDDPSGGGGDGGGGGGGGGSSFNAAGVVHLGVEEMRQIVIMYPAVHRAYEEKVPLELSEEQFWRRYLESEYFHRDRGRLGAHMGKVDEREGIERERRRIRVGSGPLGADVEAGGTSSSASRLRDEEKKRKENDVAGEEEAKNRLAAAGTDDIFSRYESKHVTSSTHQHGHHGGRHRHHHHHPHGRHHHHHRDHHHHPTHHGGMGARLAVGKFDLAATAEVERGDRFLGGDLHPPPERDSAGSRIVDKYNRHWAIVLHPAESMAGVDLKEVAARSAREGAMAAASGKGIDEDARVNGGCDGEMRRLVGFANALGGDADFARGLGDDDDDDLMELRLRDVDAYAGKFGPSGSNNNGKEDDLKLHLQYAKILAATMRAQTEPILREKKSVRARGFCNAPTFVKPFPDPKIGRGLLEALTKKLSADSRTEADVQQLADSLPEEFKTKLAAFFRRASELLRHFFSLRSVLSENGNDGQSESQKNRLANIVKGMEKVGSSLVLLQLFSMLGIN